MLSLQYSLSKLAFMHVSPSTAQPCFASQANTLAWSAWSGICFAATSGSVQTNSVSLPGFLAHTKFWAGLLGETYGLQTVREFLLAITHWAPFVQLGLGLDCLTSNDVYPATVKSGWGVHSEQSRFDSHFTPPPGGLKPVSHVCGQIRRCLCFGSLFGSHSQFPVTDVAILQPGMHFTLLLLAVNPSVLVSGPVLKPWSKLWLFRILWLSKWLKRRSSLSESLSELSDSLLLELSDSSLRLSLRPRFELRCLLPFSTWWINPEVPPIKSTTTIITNKMGLLKYIVWILLWTYKIK